MSYRDRLDSRSELFNHTWTRPKHAKAQVNGQTQQTDLSLYWRMNVKTPILESPISCNAYKDENQRYSLSGFIFLTIKKSVFQSLHYHFAYVPKQIPH